MQENTNQPIIPDAATVNLTVENHASPDFGVPLEVLLADLFSHVDGALIARAGEERITVEIAADLRSFCASKEGRVEISLTTDGGEMAGICLHFADKIAACNCADRIQPSTVITGPAGSMNLVYLVEATTDDIDAVVSDLNSDSAPGFKAGTWFPLPYGQYRLSDDDIAAITDGEEPVIYTLAEIEAALFEDEAGVSGLRADANGDRVWRWNDAEVHGEISDEVRNLPVVVSFGKGQEETKWKTSESGPLHTLLDIYLSKHVPGKKNGKAIVTGSLIGGRRVKKSVSGLYLLGLDVDSGESLEETFSKIRALNLMAIVYSTHSHQATEIDITQDRFHKWAEKNGLDTHPTTETVRSFLRDEGRYVESVIATAEFDRVEQTIGGLTIFVRTRPIDKFRILFPLKTPFIVSEQKLAHNEIIRLWENTVLGAAAMLGISIDKAARDPSRLFFLPRHPAGTNSHRILISGGDLLDWRTIEPANMRADASSDRFDRAAAEMGAGDGKESQTPTGESLKKWAAMRGDGFLLSEVLHDHCEEHLRGETAPGKFTCTCPFDDEHSNAGNPDDKGCFVQDAGEGAEQFTWHCSHNACDGRDRLDMIEKALADGWFPESVLYDPEYDCVVREDEPEVRHDTAGVEDCVRELYDEYLAHKQPDAKRTTALCAAIAKLGDDGESLVDEFKLGLSKAGLVTTSGFNQALKAARNKLKAQEKQEAAKRSSTHFKTMELAIKALNKEIALVERGSDVVIVQKRETNDGWKRPSAAEIIYRPWTAGKDPAEVFPAWLRSPLRDHRTDIVFEPYPYGTDDPVPATVYNMYKGFAVEPAHGDWMDYQRHVFHIICGGNKKLFAF